MLPASPENKLCTHFRTHARVTVIRGDHVANDVRPHRSFPDFEIDNWRQNPGK
jgi:hypothetical protein